MAFYPLLIPVFLAAGYDAVVGISVILLGAGAGVIASTVNPSPPASPPALPGYPWGGRHFAAAFAVDRL